MIRRNLFLAFSLWLATPSVSFPTTSLSLSRQVCTSLSSSAFGPPPQDKPRRQKKNKYKQEAAEAKDPLELLIEESKNKLEDLKNANSNRRTNKRISTDEKKIENLKNQPRSFVFPDNKDIDPNDPSSFGFIEIGTVVGAHGVHGEIKVRSSTGFPERFTEPGVKFFKPFNKRAPRKVVLVSGRPSKDDEYIVQLDETNNRDDANRLRGGTLFVREEEREVGTKDEPKDDNLSTNDELEEEFFISDLVGLEVFLESSDDLMSGNAFVGHVAGVVLGDEMCAIPGLLQDFLEVRLPRGKGGSASLRDELVLIPFVPAIVPRVSLEERSVFISPPEGLLDLTYVREEKVRIKGFLPSAAD